jgi:hypothetical protein
LYRYDREKCYFFPEEDFMTPEEIQKMNKWLQGRVTLGETTDGISISFKEPTPEDFAAEGFDEEAVRLTLQSDWWQEMVTDIIETPEFAEPDESPQQVLQYARDLVKEYVSKRLYPY